MALVKELAMAPVKKPGTALAKKPVTEPVRDQGPGVQPEPAVESAEALQF